MSVRQFHLFLFAAVLLCLTPALAHAGDPSDSDGDGISDEVENGAPNGGDGNSDKIQDSTQANVTSLPSATDEGYITIVTSSTCMQNQGVQVCDQDAGACESAPDKGYSYPFGIVFFVVPCEQTDVSLIFHGVNKVVGPGTPYHFRKFDPTKPGKPATFKWFDFPGAVIDGGTVTYSLNDGALGDQTGEDGAIVDPGGLAVAAVPSLPGWSPLVLSAILALGAAYFVRRRSLAT